MPLVAWTKKYSVNVRELDEQHKRLFALINDLHDALKVGEGRKATSDILGRLIEYAALHFHTEERYLATCDYPEFSAHRRAHGYFVEKVFEYQRDFEAGRISVPIDVMRFLMDWLLEHIEGTDKKYAPFLNERGLR
jgi:hemerythrin